MDFDHQCTGERGPNGDNAARTATSRRLSLAMDSQLGGADRHQHVALSIVSTVTASALVKMTRKSTLRSAGASVIYGLEAINILLLSSNLSQR